MAVNTAKTIVNAMAADVVVVGGGPAGLSAALTAAELGNSVILLEKTQSLGGGLLYSPGVITTDLLPAIVGDMAGDDDGSNAKADEPERYQSMVDGDELIALYNQRSNDLEGWLSGLGIALIELNENLLNSYSAPQSSFANKPSR